MTRRVLGAALILLSLLILLAAPVATWRAGNSLVDELEHVEGFEVTSRDHHFWPLIWPGQSDVATVTVLPDASDLDTRETVRRVMVLEGFSEVATLGVIESNHSSRVPTWVTNESTQFYFARPRADAFDADMYRVNTSDPSAGTVELWVRFFDQGSISTFVFGGLSLTLGTIGGSLLAGHFRRREAPTEHEHSAAEV